MSEGRKITPKKINERKNKFLIDKHCPHCGHDKAWGFVLRSGYRCTRCGGMI